MQDLQADFSAFLMHSVSYHPMFIDLPTITELAAKGRNSSSKVGSNSSGDNEADSAPDTFAVKGSEFFKTTSLLFQAGMHRAHEDAIFKLCEAEVKTTEKVWIVRVFHSIFFYGWRLVTQ